MAIRFFLEYNGTVIQLPVNPAELRIESTGNNKVAEIVKLGEINILRQKKLQTCSISCFFPATPNAPYVLTKGRFQKPQFYIDFIERIREDAKPARFIVSDTNINMLVGIEDFVYGMNGGDDDTHYELKLKEYRPYSVKTLKITATTVQTDSPTITPPVAERPKTGFAVGDTVVVSGNYWYNSYGAEPHGSFNNFTGRISHIVGDKTRRYRYHITTPEGGYRGWVSESQLKHK